MFGYMSFRTYLVVAFFVAIVLFALGNLGGAGLALSNVVLNFKLGAEASGLSAGITDLLYEPFRLALSGNIFVCAVVGFLWPLAVVWIILIFLMMILSVLGPGIGAAAGTIGG